jgi:subtilase family serine protease
MLVFLVLSGFVPFQASFHAYGTQGVLPQILHPLIYRPASLSTPGSPPFVPSDIRKAYDYLPLYKRGVDGNGTKISIIDAFGDPSLSSDLTVFDSLTGLPSANLNFYYPDGHPTTRDSGWALETALDVEWAHSVAPAATIDVVVAFDASLNSVFDAIAYVANGLPGESVLSMSFGLSESGYPTTGPYTIAATHQLFITMTSHGTTPFASSGDSGASTCCDVEYPASDPLVVAVGGTSLTLNSDGSYSGETAWSGSSAGSSSVYSKPLWQQGKGDSMRDIVDVSYDGDPNTGVLVVQGGFEYQVGGTSAGSPQWAALLALASQANNETYGPVAPKLYGLSTFHDVTSGSDGFFSAATGWDYPTGLGSPDAYALVNALAPPIFVPVSRSVPFQGLNVTTTGTLAANMFNSTFSGSISVAARNMTTEFLEFSKMYVLSNIRLQNRTSSLRSSFLLNIATAPYPLSSDLTLTLKNGTGTVSVMVTRQVDILGNGFVSATDIGVMNLDYGASLGSPRYNPGADLVANGTIGVVDIGIVLFFYGSPSFT